MTDLARKLNPSIAERLFPRKILYFHENQLVYPVQVTKERDFQFGYNQILSALGITIFLPALDIEIFPPSYII